MSSSTDFRTLGRLGTSSGTFAGGSLRRRSGRRGVRGVGRNGGLPMVRAVGAVVLAVLVCVFALGVAARSQLAVPAPSASIMPSMDPLLEASLLSGGTVLAATGARTIVPGGGAVAGMVEVPSPFAAVEDLALNLPTTSPAGVIYTEADAVDMLPLAPVGRMAANDNPAAFEPVREFDGPDYVVGEALTGVRPATGLARILVPPGSDLLAPVTGTVVAVEAYSRPDGGRDWRIVIEPSTRKDLHVVVRRVDTPMVVAGQEVGVGQTVIARARLTTTTPTDHNPEGLPSVWLSARPAMTEDAFDPNRPAVTPTLTDD